MGVARTRAKDRALANCVTQIRLKLARLRGGTAEMWNLSREPGGFLEFLIKRKKYRGNSPATYNDYLGVLTQRAISLGWKATENDPQSASAVIRKAWEPVLNTFAKLPKPVRNGFPVLKGIVAHRIRCGLLPETTANEHLEARTAELIQRGCPYTYARRVRADFARFASKYGLLSMFPKLVIPHRC